MLSLCLRNIRILRINNRIEKELESIKKLKPNIEIEATNADREEYFVKIAVITQIIKKNKPWIKEIEKIIPINTAIPFPPLNFNHIGNTWPKNKAIEALEKKSGFIEMVYFKVIMDFAKSKNKVKSPNFQPLNLKTLVAPIFLDPCNLGSFFLVIYEITTPNGIEPIR